MDGLSSLSRPLAALLVERGETVAVSESAAGGLISAALLAIPGASAYFMGGAVVYTRGARRAILCLPEEAALQPGSTETYALDAARAIRERLGTDWSLAESGAAGPAGNSYGDAAGHCCFAVSGPVERRLTVETADTDREANMRAFAKAGLDLLERTIRGHD